MRLAEAIDALANEYGALTALVMSLNRAQLRSPSGCKEWTNAALVFHMLTDAQRALVTFSSPADGPATTNFIDYWKGFQATDEGAKVGARFVELSTEAHPDHRKIVTRWGETSAAAVRRARETQNTSFVTTQGRVLATSDFIATLVVEATIHHLDLIVNLSVGPGPDPRGVAITTATLDGLLGAPRPETWNDVTYILKTTCRADLDENERRALGEVGERFPLFS
jgi:uncharacterized protein (TIGR03083 family)